MLLSFCVCVYSLYNAAVVAAQIIPLSVQLEAILGALDEPMKLSQQVEWN